MNAQNTPAVIRKNAAEAMAELARTTDLSELVADRGQMTVARALDQPTFAALESAKGTKEVRTALSAVVSGAMDLFAPTQRLNGSQVAALVVELVEGWPDCSFGDVTMFFRRAMRGDFDDGKVYGALSIPLLLGWWREHLTWKAEERERRHRNESAARAAQLAEAFDAQSDKLSGVVARERLLAIRRNGSEMTQALTITRECGKWTDDELREAWHIFDSDAGRALILDEARRRGLLKD